MRQKTMKSVKSDVLNLAVMHVNNTYCECGDDDADARHSVDPALGEATGAS